MMHQRWGCLLLLGLLLSGMAVCQGQTGTRTIVDMAGRKVVIPQRVQKVYATSQIGIIAIYTLNPERLAGWNFALGAGEKKYLAQKYFNLPVLGSWSGKNTTANLEEIVRIHPDCLISVGDIDAGYIESADQIQRQLRIPVVMVEGSLANLERSYRFLGMLLGEKNRAAELGKYCRQTVEQVKAAVAKVPPAKRVRVYYAEGMKGLETDPRGSFHTEVLDLAGGINVAEVPKLKGYGRSQVSPEQLLGWDPELIIAGNDKDANNTGLRDQIMADGNWTTLGAVKNRRVYQIPAYPFDWFDRPPGVNRIIGLQWLAQLLYPQYVKLDLAAAVREFYHKFYRCELTEAEVGELLRQCR